MRVVATGDALFGSRRLRERVDPGLVELFDSTPFVVTNAEFVTPGPDGVVLNVGYSLGTGTAAVDELKALGVTMVSLANNHTGDYGPQGVSRTLEAFAERGIAVAGAGPNLSAAREATLLDSGQGRLALVACCTTWGDEYSAGDGGRRNAPRAGLSPLRWSQTYEVTADQFEALQAIDEALGTAAAHRETLIMERKSAGSADSFNFGPLSGGLSIRKATETQLRWEPNREDLAEICRSIRDARRRAEVVVASVHTHEGQYDGWYSDLPAEFVIESARAMVEAGAHAVVCHGAHIIRGVEFHQGRPIFYGLHSLFFDLESGDVVPEEMYTRYGLPRDSYPSDLHGMRRRDESGQPVGFYADPRCDQAIAMVLDIDPATGDFTVAAVPLVLNINAEQPSKRGIPTIATGADAEAIAAALGGLSAPFGTTVSLADGRLVFSG